MMNLEISSNFSFLKMFKYASSGAFGLYARNQILDPVIEESKKMMRENRIEPATSPKTIKRRMARKSPKAISSNTLYDTGALHDSLKVTHAGGWHFGKEQLLGIEMEHYGKYHLFPKDFLPERNFISIDSDNNEKTSSKITRRLISRFKSKRGI